MYRVKKKMKTKTKTLQVMLPRFSLYGVKQLVRKMVIVHVYRKMARKSSALNHATST